ncbi:MAG: hypothetical protein K6E51_03485 [Treponema sp.]|nr:hypothetical protein [Treponema sp.]
MKLSKFFAAALLLTGSVFAASAQKAKIDYRYNVASDDAGSNFFNWSADAENVKDGFDAASGASKAQSTTRFNIVRFDSTGKAKAIPAGLRFVMLYPIASRATATGDNLTVQDNGGALTIRFIHRGTAYQITTDKKGTIDLSNSFKISGPLADNKGGKFIFKDEFLKAGGDNTKASDVDWSKVTLNTDVADSNASYKYTGTLKAAYKGGILTIKGTLSK